MMTAENIKIMAVSLESKKKHKAYAVYNKEYLLFHQCLPIQGKISEWKPGLLQEIEEKSMNQGFTVLVEDLSQTFVIGDASPFSFEDQHDSRSMLFHSLDWYFSMQEMGKLIFENEVKSFIIRAGGEGQRIEKLQDEKGRTIYRVDWARVSGGTKAMLMCVVGAMMPPLTNKYIDDMFGAVEEKDSVEFDPERAFQSITKGYDKARIKRWSSYYQDGF